MLFTTHLPDDWGSYTELDQVLRSIKEYVTEVFDSYQTTSEVGSFLKSNINSV